MSPWSLICPKEGEGGLKKNLAWKLGCANLALSWRNRINIRYRLSSFGFFFQLMRLRTAVRISNAAMPNIWHTSLSIGGPCGLRGVPAFFGGQILHFNCSVITFFSGVLRSYGFHFCRVNCHLGLKKVKEVTRCLSLIWHKGCHPLTPIYLSLNMVNWT